VIEYARTVLELKDANSAEFDEDSTNQVGPSIIFALCDAVG
jgi:CTP synthase (UTP-ammonia lyase)